MPPTWGAPAAGQPAARWSRGAGPGGGTRSRPVGEVSPRGRLRTAKCLSGDIDAIIISGKIITGPLGGPQSDSFSDGKVHYV